MSDPSDKPIIPPEIDARILANLPRARLEEGLRFARWAVLDGEFVNDVADGLAYLVGAEGYYNGVLIGKPTLVLFFVDTLPEMKKN